MSYETIIEAATNEFKKELSKNMEELSLEKLTPDLASQMTLSLQKAMSAAAIMGYRHFLESYDEKSSTLDLGGVTLRQKMISEKFF